MAFSAVTIFHGGLLSDNEPMLAQQPGTLVQHHLKVVAKHKVIFLAEVREHFSPNFQLDTELHEKKKKDNKIKYCDVRAVSYY